MDILLGLGTLAATGLLLSFAYGAHRRPTSAKWTRIPGLSMLTCVTLTLMGPVGLGFLIKAAITPGQELASLSAVSMTVTAALVAVAVLASPILIQPARRKAVAVGRPVADNRNVAPVQDAAIAA